MKPIEGVAWAMVGSLKDPCLQERENGRILAAVGALHVAL